MSVPLSHPLDRIGLTVTRALGLDRIYLGAVAIVLIGIGFELALMAGFAAMNGGRFARWGSAMRLATWVLPVWAACTAVYAAAHIWTRARLPDARSFAFGLAPMGLPVAATFAYADLSSPFDIAFFSVGTLPLGYLTLGPPLLVAALWARYHQARATRNPGAGGLT